VWPQWLTDALKGKVSVARAFWVYGLGVSVVYSLLAGFIDIENRPAMVAYLLLGLAVGVVQTVILWRSASNSPSKFLARMIRTALVVGLIILVPVTLYLLFTDPASLLSPDSRWRGP
jgi:hypothetical protein